MKNIVFILFLVSNSLLAQQSVDWLQSLEDPKSSMFYELKPQEKHSDFAQYDFSKALNPSSEFLGFIGSDYKRIHVNYKSIKRSELTPNLYDVVGSTTVSNNTCDFKGTITIEQFREFKNMYLGVDDMYSSVGFKAQGLAIGVYKFSENPLQKHVGTFQGIMTLWWYQDKNGDIQFYDLNDHADGFRNNQYIGTWTEYKTSNPKVCNWGEHRIPFSGDLDTGEGEFTINPKYYNKGWEAFNRD